MEDRIAVTLRIPTELHARLQKEWRKGFPKHGQSFNAWMTERLDKW